MSSVCHAHRVLALLPPHLTPVRSPFIFGVGISSRFGTHATRHSTTIASMSSYSTAPLLCLSPAWPCIPQSYISHICFACCSLGLFPTHLPPESVNCPKPQNFTKHGSILTPHPRPPRHPHPPPPLKKCPRTRHTAAAAHGCGMGLGCKQRANSQLIAIGRVVGPRCAPFSSPRS